ncbi:hypothetical protein ACROYT_G042295 [Oculina patagonica]
MESISSDSDCDSVASYADVVKGESLFSSSPARLTNSCWFKFQVESEEEAMQIALKKSASDAQDDEISDDDSLETTTPGFKEISKPRVKKAMSKQSLGGKDQPQNQGLAYAENKIKEACEILQQGAARLRQEREAINSMSIKLDHVHFSSTVNLNVGGHHFTTSVQTLTKDPNSMLAAMFSGKFEMKPSKDGSFFIDRDGTHFQFILNYLRNGKLTLPKGATFLEELEEEAEFYQIQGIIDELRSSEPSRIQASK